MRIAFVGKGGSGKSTLCASFVLQLQNKGCPIIAVDADINMHLKSLLQVPHPIKKNISNPKNAQSIRTYLKGNNNRISSPNHFVKTTPPSQGSCFMEFDPDNFVLKNFATIFGQQNFLLEVGTYEAEGVGTSCYHTSLAIIENILSHTKEGEDQWVVLDMVAGTDAFSNTLHAQFDALVLIVEPTPESIETCKKYLELARVSEIRDRIYILANKVEDEEDIAFLKKSEIPLFDNIPYLSAIKKGRQNNSNNGLLQEDVSKVMKNLMSFIPLNKVDRNTMLKQLHKLHKKYVKQDYITSTLGDLEGQIDESFSYEN